MIIQSKRSRNLARTLRSGRDVPPVDPLPRWEVLKEGLLGEVLTLVDQVDRLAPGDDLAGVAARLTAIKGRLARLRSSLTLPTAEAGGFSVH